MMLRRAIAGLLALALVVASGLPARAAQNTLVMPGSGPMSMSTFVGTWLNPAILALGSGNSGNAAPTNGPSSSAFAQQTWWDTSNSPWTLRYYDGSQWVRAGTLDPVGHLFSSAPTPIDIFLVIGDSNAVGQGSSGSSPTVQSTQALMYCANGTIVAANDPTCSAVTAAQNASTGSMWPAAAISFGRRIGYVLTGVSGSTQATACDLGVGNGNWQVNTAGSNYANSLTAINAALTAYAAAGYSPTFRGIIYVLGSNDAVQIDSSVCTAGQYTTALTAMAANYRGATIGGATYPHLELYMPIIGTNSAVADAGYSQIRAAQIAFQASDKNTTIPFTGMFSFSWRELMQVGTAHPTQAGYNIMGTYVGAGLIPGIPANNPYSLFSANAGIGGTPPNAGTVTQTIGADSSVAVALLDAYASQGQFQCRRADGTLVAPSAVQSGEIICGLSAQSFGATTFGAPVQGALLWSATQNHTDAAKGTLACLYTTANGAATPTCNLTIGQDGQVQINSGATFNWNADTFLSRSAAASIHLGQADAASPIAQTLGVQGVVAGTSNTAGTDWIVAGSQGTGTGIGGNLRFKVAPAGGSGSSVNALADAMQIWNTQRVNIGGNFAPDAPLTINANTGVVTPAAQAGTLVHLIGADSTNALFAFDSFGSGLGIFQGRLQGGSRGSPSAAPAASYTFNIQGQGYDGISAFGGLADFGIKTLNQTSASDHSGQIIFRTVASGATTLTQRMLLLQGAIFGTGTTDPGANAALLTPQAFASLTACGSTLEGAVAEVNNSTTATWGATITGGGTNKVLAHCNGANWTVMGD